MKFLIGLTVIFLRFFVGFKILFWIGQEINAPDIHSLSEIELFLVVILLDLWVSTQQNEIDIEIDKRN